MSKIQKFETERLILRPTSLDDAAFILELLNTPKWLQFIGDRKVYNLEDAAKYISQKILPQQEKLGFSNYTVIRKSDQAKMGSCGLYDREGLEGVDIGFAFLPAYEKMGYGYESALKIKEVGFDIFKIKKIKAITTKENIASQKLLEKLGLEFSKMINLPDDEEELMLYLIEN